MSVLNKLRAPLLEEIGPGWREPIQEMLKRMNEVLTPFNDVTVTIVQIGEWDGSIRVRCDIHTEDPLLEKAIRDEFQSIIHYMDDLIYRRCSVCGIERRASERLVPHYTETKCSICREKMKS